MPENVDTDGVQHVLEKDLAVGQPFFHVPLHRDDLRLRVGINQFFPKYHARCVADGSGVPQQLVERGFTDVLVAVVFHTQQLDPVVGVEDVGKYAGIVVRFGKTEDAMGFLHAKRARA